MPFVQGHLRGEALSVHFETECGHCARPMRLDIDCDLGHRLIEGGKDALVFVPLVNFAKLKASNIIDDF